MANEFKEHKVYSIFHKETGELWTARSGKTSWKATGHAKNAWAQGRGRGEVEDSKLIKENPGDRWDTRVSFSDQDIYEIREMGALVEGSKLEKAKELLRDILLNHEIGEKMDKQIEEFLYEV